MSKTQTNRAESMARILLIAGLALFNHILSGKYNIGEKKGILRMFV